MCGTLQKVQGNAKRDGSWAAISFGVNLHLLSQGLLEVNISSVINIKIFLPVIAVIILRINTIKQTIAFKAVGYTKISSNSVAIKFDVKLHYFYGISYGNKTLKKPFRDIAFHIHTPSSPPVLIWDQTIQSDIG